MILLLCAVALAEEPVVQADRAPEVAVSVVPEYPAAAQADRVRGSVVVRLGIDESGAVVEATILSGLRQDVDDAALSAARKLVFTPALQAGQPAASTVDYVFRFDQRVVDEQGNPISGSIVLSVRDQDGLEVGGAAVTLTPRGAGEVLSFISAESGLIVADFLRAGSYDVHVERDGFAVSDAVIEVEAGATQSLRLLLDSEDHAGVIVVWATTRWREVDRAAREPVLEPITGSYALTRRDVESTPGALEDVTRAVHKLPGVASDSDMLGTFSVRGSAPDEVVFQLDRVPLDNPFHLAGFNSIFNPDMLSEVQFFAGAAPSRYPDTTSAVMDVTSWDGAPRDDRHDLDGDIDISMSTARAMVMGPIGKGDDFTFAAAARRSYLELYFNGMKALNVLDTAIAAPEYDELSLRLGWKHGIHRVLLTTMRTSDHLALVDSDDESRITINGNFRLDDVLYLGALDHRMTFGEDRTLETTVGGTLDRSHLERDFAGSVSRDVERQQVVFRSDLDWKANKTQAVGFGVYSTLRRYSFDGPIEDTRAVPTWAAVPIADQGLSLLTLETSGFAPQVAAYGEHRATAGILRTRAGFRATYVGRTDEVLPSPSAGVSLALPTGTVPKLTGGLYHHVVEDPLATDATYGNPNLQAERAWQIVAGVDQGLPLWEGGLLRVEAYHSVLDNLVVNPDDEAAVAAGATYENLGTGTNTGVDVLFAAHSQRVNLAVNASWLRARRTNPLATRFPQTIAPGTDQTVTAGASVEWQALAHWRFTARYDFHSGRPMSSVEPGGADTVTIAGLNDYRLGMFNQVDLRAEWRKARERARWSVYLDVLNTFALRNDFLPIVSVTDGLQEETMLRHLPTRPFLGVRADF